MSWASNQYHNELDKEVKINLLLSSSVKETPHFHDYIHSYANIVDDVGKLYDDSLRFCLPNERRLYHASLVTSKHFI